MNHSNRLNNQPAVWHTGNATASRHDRYGPLLKLCSVVAGMAALAVLTAAAHAQAPAPSSESTSMAAGVPSRANQLARGRYLVEGVGICGHCHSPQRSQDGRQLELPGLHLAGGYGFEGPQLGRWTGANITPDADTGIGGWTEAQIVTAIREGMRPDGSVIGPPMPVEHFRKIADADVTAIAAYLKAVPPVRNAVPRSSYKIKLPANWGPSVTGVAGPPTGDAVARGDYLANLGTCMDCHTPNRVGGGGRDWARTGVGGRPIQGSAGPVVAANITPHPERGLGRWSDEQIVRAITQGISADGRRLSAPMPFADYSRMTPGDLADLVAYLRSIPALP